MMRREVGDLSSAKMFLWLSSGWIEMFYVLPRSRWLCKVTGVYATVSSSRNTTFSRYTIFCEVPMFGYASTRRNSSSVYVSAALKVLRFYR
jgi:hypothetical protein